MKRSYFVPLAVAIAAVVVFAPRPLGRGAAGARWEAPHDQSGAGPDLR